MRAVWQVMPIGWHQPEKSLGDYTFCDFNPQPWHDVRNLYWKKKQKLNNTRWCQCRVCGHTWVSQSLFQTALLPFYILPTGLSHSRVCQDRGWFPAAQTQVSVRLPTNRTFHPRVYATIFKLGWDSCVKLTSSLNWLLSHMDLKLLLFSKSVIFIFNCKGKSREELDETSATECVKQTLFTMNGSFCEVSFSTEQNVEI